jgi:hypothetical protein
MLTIRYQYKDETGTDPVAEAWLTFGKIFKTGNPDRRVKVTDLRGIVFYDSGPLDEAVCDLCNAEVGDYDPCVSADHTLYCWPCGQKWVLAFRLP